MFFRVLIIGCVFGLGCGSGNPTAPNGVIVTGKIVNNGQPLAGNPADPLGVDPPGELIFAPVSGGGGSESAILNKDGSFTAQGWEHGLRPGKYKVAVQHYNAGRGSDGLNGAFGMATTPLEIDVPADKLGKTHDLGTIDLATAGKK